MTNLANHLATPDTDETVTPRAGAGEARDHQRRAMVVKVLVSTASKHGSTGEIGNRIAAALRAELPGDAVVDVFPAARGG